MRAASDIDIDAAFDAFWSNYPRKVGKKDARKAWPAACRALAPDRLAKAAAYWSGLWAQAGTEPRFVPHPATWLRGERWNDEPPQAPRPRNAPPPGPVLSTTGRRVLEAEMLKDHPDPRAIAELHRLGYTIPARHQHLLGHQPAASMPAARALPPAGPPSGPPSGPPGPPGPPSGWPALQLVAGDS